MSIPETLLGRGRARHVARAQSLQARLCWTALLALLIAGAGLLVHLTRGTTLWFDDWNWATGRRSGFHGLVANYNGHFTLVPVLIYRALFATAGAGNWLPYRLVMVGAHLVCVTLLFVYARRRVGDYLALLAAAVLLFLGPASQNILWPFQIGWLVPIAAGLAALLLLDRRERPADIAACLLLVAAIASSGIGVAILIGAAVDIAVGRRRWGDVWIVAIPALIYIAWSVAYQHTQILANDVFVIPGWIAGSAAGAMSSLFGLSGVSVANPNGTVLEFGGPLALAGALTLVAVTRRRGVWSARALAVAAVLLSFWVITAVGRGYLGNAWVSRYLYADCIFVLLLAVELGRGIQVRWPGAAALGVLAAGSILANVGVMRDSAAFLRAQAVLTRADTAALDLGRASVPASFPATRLPGYPLVVIRVGAYYAMEHAIGTPAYTPAQLAALPAAGSEADAQLASMHEVRLEPGGSGRVGGAPPASGGASGGTVAANGACLSFTPSRLALLGATPDVVVAVPRGGVEIRSGQSQAAIRVRRFGDMFFPLGVLAPRSTAHLLVIRDAALQPWHLQVETNGATDICSLQG